MSSELLQEEIEHCVHVNWSLYVTYYRTLKKYNTGMLEDGISGWYIDWNNTFRHFINGEQKNTYGPSVITKDSWMWTEGNKIHRWDGPAVISRNSASRLNRAGRIEHYFVDRRSWYFYGIQYTEEVEKFAEENNINLKNLTKEEIFLIKVNWSDNVN